MTLLAWKPGAWRASAWRAGAWLSDTEAPPVGGWGNVVLPPRRETERRKRPLVGELVGELELQARGEGSLRLAGRAEASVLLDQLAEVRMRLGGGRLMAPMVADQEALGTLRERGRKLRNALLLGADGTADAVDADALAILLLLGDL
jgi:hypothetical protein